MKFFFSSIETDFIITGINERISFYEELNSNNSYEKKHLTRLFELKNKIVFGEEILINKSEKSLLTGILNSEVWKKHENLYNEIQKYSSLKYFALSETEKTEIELLEKIIQLSNHLNKSMYSKPKKSLIKIIRFHEKLKSNINGKWYFSHSQGKLYRIAIQINEKEYAEIELNDRNLIVDMEFFPVDMSYLSSFIKVGTKSDVLKLITDYKTHNQLDKKQDFIVKMIKVCGGSTILQ